MLVLSGVLLFLVAVQSALGAGLNDEYSVGTSLNKYLYAPKLEGEDVGRKRFIEGVTPEIMEVFEEIEKSPQLQRLLMEKFQQEEYPMDLALITKTIQQRSLPSRPFTPRFGRDSPDSQNLNSRPYPPRFGKRNNNNLPPYLPRLGRSAE